GDLVQPAPLRAVAGVGDVQPEPDALPPRHRREPEQIEGRAERVVPAVVVEGGMRLPPVELLTETELVDERQQILIGAADEVVEALDRVALEPKGAGQTAEVAGRLEQDPPVTGARQVVAGGQPGQPASDDNSALGYHRDPPECSARARAMPIRLRTRSGRPLPPRARPR